MGEIMQAVALGIVEGLTEFLPVSSTGHLILASSFMDLHGEAIASFEVFIQLGAILAVVVLYWPRFWGLLCPKQNVQFSGLRGIWLLFLTCLPASILGLLLHSFIKTYLFKPLPVAIALAAGAVLILLVEKYKGSTAENIPASSPAKYKDMNNGPGNGVNNTVADHTSAPAAGGIKYTTLDEITPKLALGIGLCQCCALWPGFSRSASTIMGGMLLGASRTLAAEYSFIAAVPIMFAATGFDLLKSWHALDSSYFVFFAVGFVVSFISALIAIKVFIRLLSRIGLAPFAWYRLLLAPLVYWFFLT